MPSLYMPPSQTSETCSVLKLLLQLIAIQQANLNCILCCESREPAERGLGFRVRKPLASYGTVLGPTVASRPLGVHIAQARYCSWTLRSTVSIVHGLRSKENSRQRNILRLEELPSNHRTETALGRPNHSLKTPLQA